MGYDNIGIAIFIWLFTRKGASVKTNLIQIATGVALLLAAIWAGSYFVWALKETWAQIPAMITSIVVAITGLGFLLGGLSGFVDKKATKENTRGFKQKTRGLAPRAGQVDTDK